MFQNILFILLCVAGVLIYLSPDILFVVFKIKKKQVKLKNVLLIVLGLISGIVLFFIVQNLI